MVRFLGMLLIALAAGCSARPTPQRSPLTPILPTGTPATSLQCVWTWATQPLPDISKRLQSAVEKSGLKGITASAEAYGENCTDTATNRLAYFAAMETDFKLVVEVDDLGEKEQLGKTLERILAVLDEFTPGAVPGPQRGSVGVTFSSGEDSLRLWFTLQNAKNARESGLHGAGLLEQLMKK